MDEAGDEDFEEYDNHANNVDGAVEEEVERGSPVGNIPYLC